MNILLLTLINVGVSYCPTSPAIIIALQDASEIRQALKHVSAEGADQLDAIRKLADLIKNRDLSKSLSDECFEAIGSIVKKDTHLSLHALTALKAFARRPSKVSDFAAEVILNHPDVEVRIYAAFLVSRFPSHARSRLWRIAIAGDAVAKQLALQNIDNLRYYDIVSTFVLMINAFDRSERVRELACEMLRKRLSP